MTTIGSFKRTGSEYLGEIVTLTLQVRNVRIVPEPQRSVESAPSHRAFVGRVEIGAGWSKRSREGRDYLAMKFDDPSLLAPLYASLVEDSVGGFHSLLWSRNLKQAGD